ncbi:hypothetical protein [Acidipropionibacterium acidipropionici]|nr:hypothetical protein [Acidipropionibacterium acidipropionici]
MIRGFLTTTALMAAALASLVALAAVDLATHGDGIGDEGMWI